ncbi:hypothetical protein E2562_027104 [Oryza meyeriana var. granulata]|uniref:Uncharacterized protein n=1 Tax=Oryza meyeriana var. granulata TaxID=110450 RepID=A0A6G1EZF7_9ORYZ|nr:hypothetical protein E2562_027104 [Oryza meyeriana var. granulata]
MAIETSEESRADIDASQATRMHMNRSTVLQLLPRADQSRPSEDDDFHLLDELVDDDERSGGRTAHGGGGDEDSNREEPSSQLQRRRVASVRHPAGMATMALLASFHMMSVRSTGHGWFGPK